MSDSFRTQDHDEIQHWVEERGGSPAAVKDTHTSKDAGILRIDFPGYSGEETLEHITWEEFFDKFDNEDLDFLCQEETAGDKMSRFCKFVTHEE